MRSIANFSTDNTIAQICTWRSKNSIARSECGEKQPYGASRGMTYTLNTSASTLNSPSGSSPSLDSTPLSLCFGAAHVHRGAHGRLKNISSIHKEALPCSLNCSVIPSQSRRGQSIPLTGHAVRSDHSENTSMQYWQT